MDSKSNRITLTIILVLSTTHLRQAAAIFQNNALNCVEGFDEELGDDCRMLKVFNRIELDKMNHTELLIKTQICACRLARMQLVWEDYYLRDVVALRVENMVKGVLGKPKYRNTYPVFLWSDIDVVIHDISIHTSTRDFFDKQMHNVSFLMAPRVRERLEQNEPWLLVKELCRRVANDSKKLYQYLENLIRINPVIFFELLTVHEPIGTIYQASKACKLLLLLRFDHYKLRPDLSSQFVSVDRLNLEELQSLNQVASEIDMKLQDASVLLTKCDRLQLTKSTIDELKSDCPMMMGNELPVRWVEQHTSSVDRSKMAVYCGCQLLLHNNTWTEVLAEPNVGLMAQALTSYLSKNRMPDFETAPLWTIHDWFNTTMNRFTSNRKNSVKELINYRYRTEDPSVAINHKTLTNEQALETLRRGCNFIMFNYVKGSDRQVAIKLVSYLDNLRYISQDPLFVFSLTLSDVNLFKIHALSKMCKPVVS